MRVDGVLKLKVISTEKNLTSKRQGMSPYYIVYQTQNVNLDVNLQMFILAPKRELGCNRSNGKRSKISGTSKS